MFNMQKQHVFQLGLEWNDNKAQKTAKEAYDRLFNLKWTPPGRGLWIPGGNPSRRATRQLPAGRARQTSRSTHRSPQWVSTHVANPSAPDRHMDSAGGLARSKADVRRDRIWVGQ